MKQNSFQDDEKYQESIARNREASKPVLEDLADAGFDIESIDQLIYMQTNYSKAIPILLQWLQIIDNSAIKESIVRALTVPWAKSTRTARLLLEEFHEAQSDIMLKWAIGNALSVVATEEVLPDIIAVIRDASHGKAREMFVISLGNMRQADVEDLLIGLLDDDELVGYAIMALGKLKSKKARPKIDELLNHKKTWVRKEAKKALKKIDK